MLRVLLILSTLMSAPTIFAQDDGLDPVGQIAYCQKDQRDAFAYSYELTNAELKDKDVEVDLLVRNFLCSKMKINGDTVYYWKLVKDKTWTVEVTVNSLYQKQIRYQPTAVEAVYSAHIAIPVEEFLSIVDQQTLRENGAVDVQRAVFFKHHNNFAWVALGAYRLTLGLHLRKHSPSTMEVLQFTN